MNIKPGFIPDINDIEASCAMEKRYGGAFEYNDFYMPSVYMDPKAVNELITAYTLLDRDRSGDTMHGAFLDMTVCSSDPVIAAHSRKIMRGSMEMGQRLGVKGVVFHTNTLAGFKVPYYVKGWMDANEAFFREICREFYPLEVYLENMFDLDWDIILAFCERMKDVENFGICLDYAHAALSKRDPYDWLMTLAPYIKHMHLNDNDLKQDLHLPMGQGLINWSRFASGFVELVESGRMNEPSILLEVRSLRDYEESLQYFEGLFH